MPAITIKSLTELFIDGVLAGNVFDSIPNHKLHIPDVQRAAQSWFAEVEKKHTAALAAKDAQIDELTALKALVSKARKALRDGKPADADKELDSVEKPERQRRKAEKQAQLAALQAEIAAL